MKKALFSILILVSLALGLGFTGLDDSAQAGTGGDSLSEAQTESVFIPVVNFSGWFNISGRVTDPQGNPVEDVTVYDHTGHQAETDINGEYLLKGLIPGNYALAPMKDGLLFARHRIYGSIFHRCGSFRIAICAHWDHHPGG
jgi:hypothetical protein